MSYSMETTSTSLTEYVVHSLQAELDAAQRALVESQIYAMGVERGIPPPPGSTGTLLDVTPRENDLSRHVSQLNVREDEVWFIHCDRVSDYTIATCFLVVDSEDGSPSTAAAAKKSSYITGRPLSVVCNLLPPSIPYAKNTQDIIMQSIIDACLRRGKQPQCISDSYRPGKILFETERMQREWSDRLKTFLGIECTGVASCDLVSSVVAMQRMGRYAKKRALSAMLTLSKQDDSNLSIHDIASSSLQREIETYYASEERMPLHGWKPPKNCRIPKQWFVCAPPRGCKEYHTMDLLGWRGNLYKAVLRVDNEKIRAIIAKQSLKDVRTFCECMFLLNVACEYGLKSIVLLLLDVVGCHVDGVQNPHKPESWIRIQEKSEIFLSRSTPLHCAARNGRLEIVRILLEHGASKTAREAFRQATPLLIAREEQHLDVVALLSCGLSNEPCIGQIEQ